MESTEEGNQSYACACNCDGKTCMKHKNRIQVI